MELVNSLPKPPEEYDKQVYDMSDEESFQERNPTSGMAQPKSETPLGDTFDLYDLSSKIHSPIKEMTRDFTLSDLNSEVVSNKLPKFIREQLKIMKVIEQYIVIPVEELEVRYVPLEAKRIHNKLIEIAGNVKELLLNEIYSMVIMSRSTDGKIIKAILMHGKHQDARDEYEGSLTSGGAMAKLTEKS